MSITSVVLAVWFPTLRIPCRLCCWVPSRDRPYFAGSSSGTVLKQNVGSWFIVRKLHTLLLSMLRSHWAIPLAISLKIGIIIFITVYTQNVVSWKLWKLLARFHASIGNKLSSRLKNVKLSMSNIKGKVMSLLQLQTQSMSVNSPSIGVLRVGLLSFPAFQWFCGIIGYMKTTSH